MARDTTVASMFLMQVEESGRLDNIFAPGHFRPIRWKESRSRGRPPRQCRPQLYHLEPVRRGRRKKLIHFEVRFVFPDNSEGLAPTVVALEGYLMPKRDCAELHRPELSSDDRRNISFRERRPRERDDVLRRPRSAARRCQWREIRPTRWPTLPVQTPSPNSDAVR
jgi:hypothetical protein